MITDIDIKIVITKEPNISPLFTKTKKANAITTIPNKRLSEKKFDFLSPTKLQLGQSLIIKQV
jgi:hypothetical protein